MTIHAPATHTLGNETTKHLRIAAEAMRQANLEGLLSAAAAEQGMPDPNPNREGRRGPAAKYKRYTATALACCLYELHAAGGGLSIKEMLDRLWFFYTEEHLDIIGMAGLRHPERAAAMKPHLGGLSDVERDRLVSHAKRAYEAEYQRLVDAWNTVFASIDDTPLTQIRNRPGTPREERKKRHTKQDVAHAAKNPSLSPKREAKIGIINAIVAGALKAENHRRYDNTDVLTGILADFKGHLAVDETHLEEAGDNLPNAVAPANYMSRIFIDSRHKDKNFYEAVVALTLGTTATDSKQDHLVPDLVLAASLHSPGPGSGTAVREIVDAVETNGLRPGVRSNATQLVVLDMGYQDTTLNEDLLARGYGVAREYKTDRNVLFEIGAVNNPDGTKAEGPRLFNGTLLCPGASMPQLRQLEKRFVLPRETRMSDAALLEHAETLAQLTPLMMPTNGRPQKVEVKKRGGQAKTQPTKKNHAMKVTVTCPALSGQVRCAVFAENDDPDRAHLPEVPAPPTHLDEHQRPACCRNTNGNQTVYIPLHEFKTWQPLMLGSWDHAETYTAARSANERYNSLLHSPTGADLSRGAIAPRSAAFWAIAIATAIAETNARSIETYDARVRAGRKPVPPARTNRRRRAERLDRARLERYTNRRTAA